MTNLSKDNQERLAHRLVEEYAYLGVRIRAARQCVEAGDWDDHPLARVLLAEQAGNQLF